MAKIPDEQLDDQDYGDDNVLKNARLRDLVSVQWLSEEIVSIARIDEDDKQGWLATLER